MVAAGVFLIARMYPVFVPIPTEMTVIAWTGAFTAFLRASIALTQNDIKKGLAPLLKLGIRPLTTVQIERRQFP